jgi:DegV family protein with EDD domain
MADVRVVTDSGADLSPEVVERLGITVIPLVVRFGETVYLDGELSIDEFWDKVSQGPHHPATSQPAMGVFEQAFAQLVDAGHPVLCVTITGRHSGTYHGAMSAARGFGDRVKVLDSQFLSLAQGFQVIAAAQAAVEGRHLEEVAAHAERVRERTRLLILLDTIEYIHRGGRADVMVPLLSRVTKVLQIRPVLNMVDGQLGLQGLVRSYGRGLEFLEQEATRLQPVEDVAVMHVRGQQMAQDLARRLAEDLGVAHERIWVAETGPLLATHSGPRVVGVVVVRRGL